MAKIIMSSADPAATAESEVALSLPNALVPMLGQMFLPAIDPRIRAKRAISAANMPNPL
jgi:hypothetical protein